MNRRSATRLVACCWLVAHGISCDSTDTTHSVGTDAGCMGSSCVNGADSGACCDPPPPLPDCGVPDDEDAAINDCPPPPPPSCAETGPTITFTHVPALGAGANDELAGVVTCVDDPMEYQVAVYIRVNGRWWPKPYFNASFTPVDLGGKFETRIVTGGDDSNATDVAAFLVPITLTPQSGTAGAEVPAYIKDSAVAQVYVTRTSNSN